MVNFWSCLRILIQIGFMELKWLLANFLVKILRNKQKTKNVSLETFLKTWLKLNPSLTLLKMTETSIVLQGLDKESETFKPIHSYRILKAILGTAVFFFPHYWVARWFFTKPNFTNLVLNILIWFSGFNLVLWEVLGSLVLFVFLQRISEMLLVFLAFSGFSAKFRSIVANAQLL